MYLLCCRETVAQMLQGGNKVIDWYLLCCRETVAQMLQGGNRVIDNPVYLSDLGNILFLLSCTTCILFCFSKATQLFFLFFNF